MKYTGKTRNFRSKAPRGSGDKYIWTTLRSGDNIPSHLTSLLEREAVAAEKLARVKAFEADLLDDGKRNYSVKKEEKPKAEETKLEVTKTNVKKKTKKKK